MGVRVRMRETGEEGDGGGDGRIGGIGRKYIGREEIEREEIGR